MTATAKTAAPKVMKPGTKVMHNRLGTTGKVVGVIDGMRGSFLEVNVSSNPKVPSIKRYRQAELTRI